jgi:hypothetical protein
LKKEESSDDDEDKGVKVNSRTMSKVLYELETVVFHPICFVPPDDVPVMTNMDNPDISAFFPATHHSFYAGVPISSDQQFNLAGFLLQWLWALDHQYQAFTPNQL